jgi:hypothetical protein
MHAACVTPRARDNYFNNVGRSAESLWVSTFGIGGAWDALDQNGEVLAKVVYYFYLIMAPLILINIFIAMTNDVYTTIYSDKVWNSPASTPQYAVLARLCKTSRA